MKLPDHTDAPNYNLTGEIRRMTSPLPQIIPTVEMRHVEREKAILEARATRNHYPAM